MKEITIEHQLVRQIGLHWPILEALHEKNLLSHKIGEVYGRDKRWASIKLKPLRLLALVTYTINVGDEREKEYRLTERGREIVSAIMKVIYKNTSPSSKESRT